MLSSHGELLVAYPQGHLREGKCHLLLGNALAASRCFQRVLEMEPDNSQAQQEVSLILMIAQHRHASDTLRDYGGDKIAVLIALLHAK